MRQFFLDLSADGLRMPIGSDLLLHAHDDPNDIVRDGARLGAVLKETAERFRTPLGVSRMNLELEKSVLLQMLGVPAAEVDKFHFPSAPSDEELAAVDERFDPDLDPRLRAHIDSIAWIAANSDLLPVGMSIGPFSLMTKLLADPIMPIYSAGMGITAAEDPDVAMLERVLEIATRFVLKSLEQQIEAGAKAVLIADPAANKVFISPKQMAAGSNVFERLPIAAMRRVKALLDAHDVDLIFHCCGELTDSMLTAFTTLRPVMISLGSSRVLWEDAAIVPKDIVLYGNLPSKSFYSDDLISRAEVEARACTLIAKMREANHPFILGSECDILSVPGCEETLLAKADLLASCACG
ncbi:MAG TPA: uroporphyrinogen decarboxylase family protein [Armatimonadota bacterium]|jgi:uroporphyrinogen-III decarboxylase